MEATVDIPAFDMSMLENTFDFDTTPTEVVKENELSQLKNDIKSSTESLDNSDVNYIFAKSGNSIASLGFTNETWNSLSQEEKNNILDCR
jgi:hypothetical protein